MPRQAEPIINRLASRSHVTAGGCIETNYCHDRNGYPKVKVGHKNWTHGHRLAWEQVRGEIPEGMWVLHTCDNSRCINVDHLYLGTVTDNNRDKSLRSRSGIPTTPEMVAEVRRLHASGVKGSEIAGQLGRSKNFVYGIVNGHTWA